MRGNTFLNRVGIATLAGALLVTPALSFNTGSPMWKQITFGASSFDPPYPTQLDSKFNYSGGWSTATAVTPGSWNPYSGPGNAYGAPGFSSNSQWVGSNEFEKGGWSIFYLDFYLGSGTVEGKFSSDNTSYLFLDGWGLTGLGYDTSSVSGSGEFEIETSMLAPGGPLLKYHPVEGPQTPAQNSYNSTTDFSFTASGSHRLWALVRNDNENAAASNPLGFRLEFMNDSGSNMTPVPEPFTMALGAAGIGLALRRRMKKAK